MEAPETTSRIPPTLIKIGVFVLYFGTAYYGLKLGAVSGFAALVWPPTGLALVAGLIYGPWIWPAVGLAAFFVNYVTGASWTVAAGIAIGNTLEMFVGLLILRDWVGFQLRLDRTRDVIGLAALAAPLSAGVSATLGVLSLYLGGVVPALEAGRTWRAWWLGDVLGYLVVAPLLLVGLIPSSTRSEPRRFKLVEAGVGGLLLTFASMVVFGGWSVPLGVRAQPLPFLLFPFAVWAALRFGRRGAILCSSLISVIALWGATRGTGPFVAPLLSDRLTDVQLFVGILSVTGLTLAASLVERMSAEAKAKALYQEARSAVEARDEFLSIASHELKTPLTSLSLQLDLAQRSLTGQWETLPAARAGLLLDSCRQRLARLSRLIDDLLDVSRARAGKLSLSFEDFELAGLVEEVAERFSAEIERTKTPLELKLEPGIRGRWDRSRLDQVLVNLVSNALRYAPGKTLIISSGLNGELAFVRVRDSGPGIDPDRQEKIFDRFESHGSGSHQGGLGLGLYIARQIVEGHRGLLRVESEAGRGACFIVELPRA